MNNSRKREVPSPQKPCVAGSPACERHSWELSAGGHTAGTGQAVMTAGFSPQRAALATQGGAQDDASSGGPDW